MSVQRLERALRSRLDPARQAVDRAADRLERRVRTMSTGHRSHLQALAGRLEALSPLATLARGYSVARTADGVVLRRVADLPAGSPFHLRVSDGTVRAESKGPILEDVDE